MTDYIKATNEILSDFDLKFSFRSSFSNDWDNVLKAVEFVPVAYTQSWIDYQIEYTKCNNVFVYDLSMIIKYNNNSCAIWPIQIVADNDKPIQSNGNLILPPLFVKGITKRVQKKIINNCIKCLNELVIKLKGKYWESGETYKIKPYLSIWYKKSMDIGGIGFVKHDLYIELEGKTIDNIKSTFRKSYRPLINSALKQWSMEILDSENIRLWEKFTQLHEKVSGKVTRSKETWDLQYNAILNGSAFLVCVKDDKDKLVGGGLFLFSRDECIYGVGAYLEEQKEIMPIGHIVQYTAIIEMLKRNIKLYFIGPRHYSAHNPAPTEKMISISKFKEGFTNNIYTRNCIKYIFY